MKMLSVGAGPAGLSPTYLPKRQDANRHIRIVEPNPPHSTFGFGVGFAAIGRLQWLQMLQMLKLVDDANCSAAWQEHFAEHMQLEPWAMAWSCIQRNGRVDIDWRRQVSPRFVAGYQAWATDNRR